MAALKNRTSEFHAAVESIRDRAGASSALRPSFSSERQMLVAGGGGGPGGGPNRKSHFARMAGAIGMEINKVATKLERLAKLAKQKSLFNDRPVEISELTFVIKQDIAKLNKQIMSLQQYVKEQKGKSKSRHFEEHTSNVVVSLQSKLASTSMSFKDVLELRTQNMKAQKDRREQFMHTSQPGGAGGALSVTTGSPLYSIDREDTERSAGEVSINLGFDSQQLQMTDRQDSYIESRSNAVATVEQTMAELGSIFQQLATMVAEQRETIQRIDANTLDIQSNVEAGGRELRQYMQHVMSNRWLMAKIFGIIIFFVLLWVLVT